MEEDLSIHIPFSDIKLEELVCIYLCLTHIIVDPVLDWSDTKWSFL